MRVVARGREGCCGGGITSTCMDTLAGYTCMATTTYALLAMTMNRWQAPHKSHRIRSDSEKVRWE